MPAITSYHLRSCKVISAIEEREITALEHRLITGNHTRFRSRLPVGLMPTPCFAFGTQLFAEISPSCFHLDPSRNFIGVQLCDFLRQSRRVDAHSRHQDPITNKQKSETEHRKEALESSQELELLESHGVTFFFNSVDFTVGWLTCLQALCR